MYTVEGIKTIQKWAKQEALVNATILILIR